MFTTKQNNSPVWDKAAPVMSKLPPHYPVLSAQTLLKGQKYEPLLTQLKDLAFVPDPIFNELYLKAIHTYVEFVQGLPATQVDSFNYHGGLLELGIRRAIQTLAWYRREYPLRHATPEQMPARQAIWSYALFTAGLMYGIGQVVATYWIMLCNEAGSPQQRWNPVNGKMKGQGDFYRYSFETARRDELAARSTVVLAMDILPKEGIGWIATDSEIFNAWLSILLNDEKHAGLFAKFVYPVDAELAKQANLDAGLLIGEVIEQYEMEDEKREKNQQYKNQNDKIKEITKQDKDNKLTNSGMFIAGKEAIDASNTSDIGKTFISWLRDKHARERGAGGQLLMVTPHGLLISFELAKLFSEQHSHLGSAQTVFSKLEQSNLCLGRVYQKTTNSLAALAQQNSAQGYKLAMDLTACLRKTAEINNSLDLTLVKAGVSIFPDVGNAIAAPSPAAPLIKP